MKQFYVLCSLCRHRSLPMRECGLKQYVHQLSRYSLLVTPHAGVWIETNCSRIFLNCGSSLPMRECGLKLVMLRILSLKLLSLPMRECGLKPDCCLNSAERPKSLPMRECGLKQLKPSVRLLTWLVTPHAGVWIETGQSDWDTEVRVGHSPCGSVD